MATLAPLRPRRRKRRLWIGLAVVLAAVFAWRGIEGVRENVARRPFVGTWRLESWADPARPKLVWETDLRPDGTQHSRLRDSTTGDIDRDLPSNMRWRVVEGRLQQGHYGQTLLNEISHGPWGVVLIVPWGWVASDGSVTWEGPDRFRYRDDKSSREPQVWVRVAPAEK